MYYALVRYDMVRTVAVGDADFATYAATKYDYVIDVTDMDPRPVQGDSYYGGKFVSNTETELSLDDLELDPAIPEGLAVTFAPFQLSKYAVSFADGVVTIGCKHYGAKGLLQVLYALLVESAPVIDSFHVMDTGPAHGRYGITWDDANLLYTALTSLQRSVL